MQPQLTIVIIIQCWETPQPNILTGYLDSIPLVFSSIKMPLKRVFFAVLENEAEPTVKIQAAEVRETKRRRGISYKQCHIFSTYTKLL